MRDIKAQSMNQKDASMPVVEDHANDAHVFARVPQHFGASGGCT